jgi:predicted transcriptional regulator of viral defense system
MAIARDKALGIIQARGGTIRTSDAIAQGIHPRTLYGLRDSGELERLDRGIYRLAHLPPLGDPDIALVAGRVPQAVLCLVSALAVHGLTTQIPHSVHIALPRGTRPPRLSSVPITAYQFSERSYQAGVQRYSFDGGGIPIFSPEKTIADCFKYRNKLGLDLTLEALANYRRRKKASLATILKFAEVNRVAKPIRPYLEAVR